MGSPSLPGVRRSASFAFRTATKRLVFAAGRACGRLPVVTYATWRTSSTAVHHAVRRSGAWPCVKAHALHPDRRFREYSASFRGPALADRLHVGDVVARRALLEAGREARWIIVVRDPLAMAASLLAMEAVLRDAVFGTDGGAGGPADAAATVARAPVELLDRWFELDVRPSLGWSPLDEPFDRDRGWTVGRSPRGPVLTLCAELDDAAKGRALSGFLGRAVEVGRVNSSRSHRAGGRLESVQAILSAHGGLLEAADRLPSARHFWGPGALERSRASWRRGG